MCTQRREGTNRSQTSSYRTLIISHLTPLCLLCVCVWQALWISKVTLQGRLQLLYKRKRVCVLLRRDTLWSDLSWDGLNVMIQCSIPSLKRKTEKLVFNVSGLFDVYESRYLHNGWSEEGERKQFATERQKSGPTIMIHTSIHPKPQHCSDFILQPKCDLSRSKLTLGIIMCLNEVNHGV